MAVDLDRVTDYIAGRLSPIENHAFELQLMEDSELHDALEELLLLRDHAIRRQPESAPDRRGARLLASRYSWRW